MTGLVIFSKERYRMKLWKRVSGKRVWKISISAAIHFWRRKRVSGKRVSVSVGLSVVNSANNDPAKIISRVSPDPSRVEKKTTIPLSSGR